jgi:hypothetical protein
LTTYYESKQLGEDTALYNSYSFIYVGGEFGIVRKQANSAIADRFTLPDLTLKTIAIDPNGFFTNLAALTFIQRREDIKSDPDETRDIYGFCDNTAIYKFDAILSSATLKATSKILLPTTGINILSNRMIDIGRYHIAVYSGANCNAFAS